MLHNRVRELRKLQGWTQEELCDRLDVSRMTLSSIENSRYMPSLELAFTIAEVFGKPLEEVFYRDDNR